MRQRPYWDIHSNGLTPVGPELSQDWKKLAEKESFVKIGMKMETLMSNEQRWVQLKW